MAQLFVAGETVSTDIRRIPAVLRSAWLFSPAAATANRSPHRQMAIEAFS
jgi:hypothetical protein